MTLYSAMIKDETIDDADRGDEPTGVKLNVGTVEAETNSEEYLLKRIRTELNKIALIRKLTTRGGQTGTDYENYGGNDRSLKRKGRYRDFEGGINEGATICSKKVLSGYEETSVRY